MYAQSTSQYLSKHAGILNINREVMTLLPIPGTRFLLDPVSKMILVGCTYRNRFVAVGSYNMEKDIILPHLSAKQRSYALHCGFGLAPSEPLPFENIYSMERYALLKRDFLTTSNSNPNMTLSELESTRILLTEIALLRNCLNRLSHSLDEYEKKKEDPSG